MEMRNVLDQLKKIAENNDSEDVARAIGTVNDYAKLAERQGVREDIEDGMGDYRDEEDDRYDADGNMDSDDSAITRIQDRVYSRRDNVEESPGQDDQYCPVCGNTGTNLETGEECSVCADDTDTPIAANYSMSDDDDEWERFESLNNTMNPITESTPLHEGDESDPLEDMSEFSDEDAEFFGHDPRSSEGDDQYESEQEDCSVCGNTGTNLETGEECSVCGEGDAIQRVQDRVADRNGEVTEDDDDWKMQGGEDGLGPDGDGRHDRQQYNDYGEDPWGLDETVLDESVPFDLADIKQRIMDMTKLLSGGGLDKATSAAAGEKKNRLGQMANFMQQGMEREEAASKAGIQ